MSAVYGQRESAMRRGVPGAGPASCVCAVLGAVAVLLAASGPALGATVTAEASSREVLVGESLQLEVKIENASQTGQPQVPATEDFIIRLLTPTPQRSSFTQIVNGRMSSRSTLTYVYSVRARRSGSLTIPAITVEADGKVCKTEAIPIVVAKGETSDLLFVEFIASRRSVFVEQPFDLTLRVWVRPFRQGRVKLSERDMLSRFSSDSDFGSFAELVAKGSISVRTALRKDNQGQEHEYYVYELTQTVRPDKAGPYTPEPVIIAMVYPTRLEQDMFGRLSIAGHRRLVKQASAPAIVIKPIPQEGRPSTYNGAIGRYRWKVWADRTDVRRGELITLNMEITADGPLDRVPAPPLSKMPDLTEHFKVLDEQLAGEIKDKTKTFRQKIRAIDVKATAIPPIPFVFFDPQADEGKGRFVTLSSEPIPITVHAAEVLKPEEVIAPDAMGPGRTSLLTEAADSIRANYTEPDVVIASEVFAPGPGWAAALALPPGIWLAVGLIQRRSARLRADVALARRRGARKNAESRLASAKDSQDPAGDVADAIRQYVADRANLPAGGLMRGDAVERLRASGVPDETVAELDGLWADCEAARYAGMAATSDEIIERASRCLRQLERTWKA